VFGSDQLSGQKCVEQRADCSTELWLVVPSNEVDHLRARVIPLRSIHAVRCQSTSPLAPCGIESRGVAKFSKHAVFTREHARQRRLTKRRPASSLCEAR